MHYEIRRAHKTGRQLTVAQRSSPLFAEEPVVLGKVLRRNGPHRVLPADVFQQNRSMLLRQAAAGAIEIFEVDGDKRTPYATTAPTEAQVAQEEAPKAPPVEEPPASNPTVPPVPSEDMDAPMGETAMKAEVPAAEVLPEPDPEPTPVVETKKKKQRY